MLVIPRRVVFAAVSPELAPGIGSNLRATLNQISRLAGVWGDSQRKPLRLETQKSNFNVKLRKTKQNISLYNSIPRLYEMGVGGWSCMFEVAG